MKNIGVALQTAQEITSCGWCWCYKREESAPVIAQAQHRQTQAEATSVQQSSSHIHGHIDIIKHGFNHTDTHTLLTCCFLLPQIAG